MRRCLLSLLQGVDGQVEENMDRTSNPEEIKEGKIKVDYKLEE